MSPSDKPLVWLHSEVKSPPLSAQARLDAGYLLRALQKGQTIPMPDSRPMPSIGRRVHELRISDGAKNAEWRIVYRIDPDAIVVVHVFQKKTPATPQSVVTLCKARLTAYDE